VCVIYNSAAQFPYFFFLIRIGRHRKRRIDRVEISSLSLMMGIFPHLRSIIYNVLPFPSLFYLGLPFPSFCLFFVPHGRKGKHTSLRDDVEARRAPDAWMDGEEMETALRSAAQHNAALPVVVLNRRFCSKKPSLRS